MSVEPGALCASQWNKLPVMSRGLLRQVCSRRKILDLLLAGVASYMFIYFAVTPTVLLVDQVPAVRSCFGFR